MTLMLRDLKVAVRQLRKAPGFNLAAILTLTLGIGATVAMFSIVEGILLRPLPFRDADRLVILGEHVGNSPGISVTARELSTWSNSATAFASMGGFFNVTYELSGGATPEVLPAARLTSTVFQTLGVKPVLGRAFTSAEDEGHQPVAVLSDSLWAERFHRDPDVLGQSILLDRRAYTIVGVMPRTFEFPMNAGRANQARLWVPMSLTSEEVSPANAGRWGFNLVARLKDGVTLEQATADARRVAAIAERNFPPTMSSIRIRGDVVTLREQVVGQSKPILRTLFGAVLIVLLIACTNVAGLLLVRVMRRRRDYAVQLAIGAGARDIFRQSMAEGLVLGLASGISGIAVAWITLRTLLPLLPESMPRLSSISIDPAVVLFALMLASLTGVGSSLIPAVAAVQTNLIETLKDGARSGTGFSSQGWLRSALVVTEVAVALILLTTAGEFLRSYQKMLAVDPGFRPDHLLIAGYQLPIRQYGNHISVANFDRRVLDELNSKPGVVAAGLTSSLPSTFSGGMSAYTIESQPSSQWKLTFAGFSVIDGDYLRAMGIPIYRGRAFTAADNASAPYVVMVNQSMAQHCWPGQNPVGQRIHAGNPNKQRPWATVVGVVGNTKGGALDQPDGDQWFIPAAQESMILDGEPPAEGLSFPAGGFITLRSVTPPDQMLSMLRASVAAADPLLALDDVRSMQDVVSTTAAPRRFNTGLMSGFAAAALLLALSGIYATIAFSVSIRRQEIAIRMALGAARTGIARMIVISGMRLAFIGSVLGIAGSALVSRLLQSFLFEVQAIDPVVYAFATAAILLVAAMASALPAGRASRLHPMDALRSA